MTQLIIAGWTDYAPTDRETALAVLTVAATKSRPEPGCLDFYICADPTNPSRIVTYERWATTDDHATHLLGSHVADLRAGLSGLAATARDLRRFLAHDEGTFARPTPGVGAQTDREEPAPDRNTR